MKKFLTKFAMTKLLPLLIKKVAEGDFGQWPAKLYWALAGRKFYISIAIGLLGVGLDYLFGIGVCDSCGGYKGDLMTFAAVLAAIGLYDGAVRSTPPEKKDA